MKIQFLKKEKNFKKEKLHLSPNVFWKMSILMVFVVFLASCFWGYLLFKNANEAIILSPEETSGQVETVKKDRIDKVLQYFSDRKTKSNEILHSPSPLRDPSL